HVYVFDIATRALRQLTLGDYDDSSPVWSPDGRMLAFVSNRDADPDTTVNTDVWVVPVPADLEAAPTGGGADAGNAVAPRRLTGAPGSDRDRKSVVQGKA